MEIENCIVDDYTNRVSTFPVRPLNLLRCYELSHHVYCDEYKCCTHDCFRRKSEKFLCCDCYDRKKIEIEQHKKVLGTDIG